MQNTSSSYLLEIKQPSRLFECRVTIGDNIYTNTDVINMTIEDVQPGDGFIIGSAVSKSLELTLSTTNTIYSNSTVKVEIGLVIGSKTEYILMGYFNIDDIEKTDYSIKLICFDNMMKFEKAYFSKLGKTSSLTNIVNELAQITGVEFTGSLPSYNLNKLEGFTCREILGFVASLSAGNAYITRDGKFTIKTPKQVDYSITDENYINYKKEDIYKIGAVTCHVDEKELTKGTLSNSTMEVAFENPWVNDSILIDIYNKLKDFEYVGYSMKWQGDLALDVGDIISLTDNKGVTSKIPILSQKLNYNGGLTSEIGAKGESKNKNEFSSAGNLNNKVNRVVTDLLLVNKALINKADIEELKAVNADIENLIAENVTITGKLNAVEGEFGNIKSDVAAIENLTVNHTAKINDLIANKASIGQVEAISANIGTLEVKVGKIDTLINGNLTSDNIQSLILSSSKVTVENGFIKNAMIDSLDVSKVNAGDISTNKFRIKSDDGGIEIVGATQQFKDKNNKVRIQMGQDAQGNFNFIIRGEDGTSTLIDHEGVKEKAIADDLIKNNMIASDAVGEKQINYSSFITGFNKDTNTNTIKSTKIMLNNQNQTLDVAFNQLKTQADGTKKTTESNTTSIGVMQGQINALISDTTVTEDGSNKTIKDVYTSLKATVNGISTKVADVESDFINMEIGGVNLLRYTTFEPNYDQYGWKLQGTIVEGFLGKPAVNIDYSSATSSYTDSLAQTIHNGTTKLLEGGKWYTFSFYVKGTGSVTTHIYPSIIDSYIEGLVDGAPKYLEGDGARNWLLTDTWTRHTYTFKTKDTIPGKSQDVLFRTPHGSNVFICMPKLEQGNKVTQWSISPLDTDEKIQGVTDNLVNNYSTTKAMNSAIEQKTSGILTTVSNTYATKGTVTDLNNNLKNNYSTTSAMNSAINQKAGEITQSVSDTYTSKNEFNKLQIGGTNILPGTKDFTGWHYDDQNFIKDKLRGFTVYHNKYTPGSSYSDFCKYEVFEPTPNTEYTLSFWAKGSGTILSYFFSDAVAKGVSSTGSATTASDGSITTPLTSEWKQYWITWTTKANISGIKNIIVCRQMSSPSEVYIYAPKFELGNKVTDWSPSPQDSETQLKSLTSRVQTAESKLTKTSLTTTIGNHYTTSSDVNGIVTSKGYQTQAQVQQTVNGLEVKVSQSGGYNLIPNSTGANGNTRGWTHNGSSFGVSTNDTIGSNCRTYMYLDNEKTTAERFAYSSRFKLKPSTKYTFVGYFHNYATCPSFDVYILSSTSLTDTDISKGYTNAQAIIEGQSTNGNWKKFKVTFTTPANTRSGFIRIDNNGYNANGGTSPNRIHWNALMLTEGSIEIPWSPHPSEIYDGITTIDKDGITVIASSVKSKTTISANGFKIIKTDTNEEVFKVNSSGRLELDGIFRTRNGNRKSGYFGLDKIVFYNWWDDTNEAIAHFYGGQTSSGKRSADVIGKDLFSLGVGEPGSGAKVLEGSSSKLNVYKDTDFNNWKLKDVNSINEDTIKSTFIERIVIRSSQVNTNHDSGNLNLNYWKGYNATSDVEVKVCDGNNSGTRGKLTCQDFKAYGTKNACVQTSIGYVGINAYETADYYFGDIGETILDNDGYSYVYIDSIFAETVNTSRKYQVFLSVYGEGVANVIERYPTHFIIKGTPGIEVGYEIKAKRKGYEDYRFEREENQFRIGESHGLDEEYDQERINFNNNVEKTIDEEITRCIENKTLEDFVTRDARDSIKNKDLIEIIEEDLNYENIN